MYILLSWHETVFFLRWTSRYPQGLVLIFPRSIYTFIGCCLEIKPSFFSLLDIQAHQDSVLISPTMMVKIHNQFHGHRRKKTKRNDKLELGTTPPLPSGHHCHPNLNPILMISKTSNNASINRQVGRKAGFSFFWGGAVSRPLQLKIIMQATASSYVHYSPLTPRVPSTPHLQTPCPST